jgi:hypothetical protein
MKGMDVVRVANLMQPVYFSKSELRLMARNVRRCCAGPGSMVVLCRVHDHAMEASLLSLNTNGTFSVLRRIGAGSIAEGYFTTIEDDDFR